MPTNDDFFRFGRSAAVLTAELRKHYPIEPGTAPLDPLVSAVDVDLLRRRLLDRIGPPPQELVLTFDVTRTAQLRALVPEQHAGAAALVPADRAALERMDGLLGTGWRQECLRDPDDPADDRPAAATTLRVAQACADRLAGVAGYHSVVLPVRLRPQLNPAHVLLLVTVRDDAGWRLADALGRSGLAMERAWHRARIQAVPPGEPTVFGDAPTFRPDQYLATNSAGWIRMIGINLTRLLDRYGAFLPSAHVPEIYGSTLGQAWTEHVRAAVFRLHRQGAVGVTGRGEFWNVPLGRLAA